jgi:hypothetical protein
MVLKKEIVKTQSSSSDASDRGPEYRQMLVGAIHTCAAKFPDVSTPRLGALRGAAPHRPRALPHRPRAAPLPSLPALARRGEQFPLFPVPKPGPNARLIQRAVLNSPSPTPPTPRPPRSRPPWCTC